MMFKKFGPKNKGNLLRREIISAKDVLNGKIVVSRLNLSSKSRSISNSKSRFCKFDRFL